MSREALDARVTRLEREIERGHADDAESASPSILARPSLRAAKAERRRATRAYMAVLAKLDAADCEAVGAYTRALSHEAAANRVEARELREFMQRQGGRQ